MLNPFGNDSYGFHIETERKIANFLLDLHQPFLKHEGYVREKSETYNKTRKFVKQACPKCKSTNLEIKWGHNYYFKCLDCGHNIPIRHTCNTPECKPKTKKRGLNFYKICDKCGIDELFHINPSQK